MKEQTQRPATITHSEGERHPRVMDMVKRFNELEELRSRGQLHPSATETLRPKLHREVEEFRASGGDGHSNPDWIATVLHANTESTFGHDREALKLETEGLALARSEHEKAVSCNNLCHHHLVLGELEEALRRGREAIRWNPRNEGALINLALALYRGGDRDQARTILVRLAEITGTDATKSVLGLYLQYEEVLFELNDVLPEVFAKARQQ